MEWAQREGWLREIAAVVGERKKRGKRVSDRGLKEGEKEEVAPSLRLGGLGGVVEARGRASEGEGKE